MDLITHQWDCSSRETCVSLSDNTCKCVAGDAFKLFYTFQRSEGSGLSGVLLTLIIYGCLVLISIGIFYIYLIYLHRDGKLIDIYQRLTSRPECFYVPNDFEVSVNEIKWVCFKASVWKGPTGDYFSINIRILASHILDIFKYLRIGASRKISVCDYTLTDPFDQNFKEVTTHLCIYTQELNGSRTLNRHFLRQPDGTMLEIFGDLNESMGINYNNLQKILLNKKDSTPDEALKAFDVKKE